MKKVLSLITVITLLILLVGCAQKTYDSLYDDFSTYVSDEKETYDGYINYINQLSENTIKSVVMVQSAFTTYNVMNYGSGVIIAEDSNFYYALTNYHVTHYLDDRPSGIEIIDYLNKKYRADLLYALDSYDLALLRFSKDNLLMPITFAQTNPEENDVLTVFGYPDGQYHTITMGFFIEYSTLKSDDANNAINRVTFEVLVSNVPVKPGSSGSVILNNNNELVGIIYAGAFDETSGDAISTHSYAIPFEKINEFVEMARVW